MLDYILLSEKINWLIIWVPRVWEPLPCTHLLLDGLEVHVAGHARQAAQLVLDLRAQQSDRGQGDVGTVKHPPDLLCVLKERTEERDRETPKVPASMCLEHAVRLLWEFLAQVFIYYDISIERLLENLFRGYIHLGMIAARYANLGLHSLVKTTNFCHQLNDGGSWWFLPG